MLRLFCLAGLVVLIALNASAQSAKELAKAQELLKTGNELLQQGDASQAVAKFNEVAVLLPTSPVAYINRGLAFAALGKYVEALADADKALSLVQPDRYAARFSSLANQVRARVYQDQQDYELAIKFYSKAIDIDSSNPVFYISRGVVFLILKQHDKAINDFSKTIELNPKLTQPYVNRAVAYRALKNCDAAIRDTMEAIRLSPSDIAPYLNRANCYLDLKKYDEAIEDLTYAISIEPKADLFYNRARAHSDRGDFATSVSDNTEAINREPKHEKAYYNRGISYQRTKQYGLAIADLRKALSFNEDSPSRRYNLAIVLYEARQYSEAIKEATILISNFPEWRAPVALRSNAYGLIGESMKMKADAIRADKLDATWKPKEEGFFILNLTYFSTKEEDL